MSAAVSNRSVLFTWGGDRWSKDGSMTITKTLVGLGIQQLDSGGDFCACLTRNNDLYMWGANSQGQLGTGDQFDRQIPRFISIELKRA